MGNDKNRIFDPGSHILEDQTSRNHESQLNDADQGVTSTDTTDPFRRTSPITQVEKDASSKDSGSQNSPSHIQHPKDDDLGKDKNSSDRNSSL